MLDGLRRGIDELRRQFESTLLDEIRDDSRSNEHRNTVDASTDMTDVLCTALSEDRAEQIRDLRGRLRECQVCATNVAEMTRDELREGHEFLNRMMPKITSALETQSKMDGPLET